MLDDRPESDSARIVLMKVRRDFKLDEGPASQLENYANFRDALDEVKYAGLLAQEIPASGARSLPVPIAESLPRKPTSALPSGVLVT